MVVSVTFAVYKKHYPPALHDEVWRLDRMAKDGALHKKLMKSEVITVEDFLRVLARDPQRLRNVSFFCRVCSCNVSTHSVSSMGVGITFWNINLF